MCVDGSGIVYVAAPYDKFTVNFNYIGNTSNTFSVTWTEVATAGIDLFST